MQVKLSQAVSMMTTAIKAGLVPMFVGSPGCGKSQSVYQIANTYKLKVIDLRLSQCDPTDLLGMPSIIGKKAGYVPMETFPIEGDAIPAGYSGWLLFLDEFNSAVPAVQAAAYKLVLDRMVGIHHLHKNVAIVCAGNLETDNAIVQPMSTALQSRLIHMELVVDCKEFLDWAYEAGFDHRITDQLKFKPGNLFTFKPDHTDKTYACPRTWEFANKLLKHIDVTDKDALPLLAGTLSEGVAREFIVFCKIYKELPSIEQIRSEPHTVVVPTEPSIIYALTGALSNHASKENFNDLMVYINRMPSEFQIVTLRETIRRNSAMLAHSAVQSWIKESGVTHF